jgi:hypothetical protein
MSQEQVEPAPAQGLPQERARGQAVAAGVFVIAAVLLGWSVWESRPRNAQRRGAPQFRQLAEVQETASPILSAIRIYEKMNAEPPAKLAALTGEYLRSLPGPPAAVKGSWNYTTGNPLSPDDPKWTLWVVMNDGFCPRHPRSSGDVFVYRSTGSYPDIAYGGEVQRLHDWGYYHQGDGER